MSVQPNRHTLDALVDTLVSGNRDSTEKKLYAMRSDHLDMVERLRGNKTAVAMLRYILDDWRNMKIKELRKEIERLEAMAV